jgi:hypothetical protein
MPTTPPVSATLDLSEYYTPHTGGQAAFHASPAKTKVIEAGRRWGKSRAALFELIRRYLESLDKPVSKALVPPFHAWVVAPSYPQSNQVWNELISFLPPEIVAPNGIHQDERFIYLRGTEGRAWGLIEVKSAHNSDALQTAGLDVLWVTEAQDVSDKAFQRLLPTLRSPERMSYAIYEGIPSMWADHWFRRVYEMAERGREGYLAFKATVFDNPMLDEAAKAEIEADREVLPDAAWRRMYLAEFSESAGYFRNISECVAGDLMGEPVPGVEYVGGLDLGRKLDASVLVIMDATQRCVVQHFVWDQGADWPVQREGVANHSKFWGLARLVIDATGMGGDIFVSEMQELGLPVEPFIITASSREALLQGLSVSLERQTVHYPPVPSLLRQLRAFQARRTPSGGFKAEAPPGEHDDEVFGLALALTACAEPPRLGIDAFGGMGRASRRSRYVPTQDEANSGYAESQGARIMRQRRVERMMERADRAGIR